MLEWLGKVATSTKRVVHYNGHAVFVCNLHDLLKIRNVVSRIANLLDINRLGLLVDQLFKVFRLVALDEFGLDPQAGQEDLELVIGAAVEVGGGDNIVAGAS